MAVVSLPDGTAGGVLVGLPVKPGLPLSPAAAELLNQLEAEVLTPEDCPSCRAKQSVIAGECSSCGADLDALADNPGEDNL